MAIARFRKRCLDSRDPSSVGPFWAAALARRWAPRDDGEGGIVKVVKNRIHPDLAASDPGAVLAAGATLLREPDADVAWYVMADPEGNEFRVFAER